jgi:hypothetical protein
MNVYCWQILGCGLGVNLRIFLVIPLMFEGVGFRSSSVSLLILDESVCSASFVKC